MSQWYFNDSGEQRGPIPHGEIMALRASGKITADTLVWSEGMTDWKPAGSIPELVVEASAPLSPYAPPAAEPESEVDWSGYVPSGPQARPWVRYWARTFDFLFFCLIFGTLTMAFLPDLEEMSDTVFGAVMLLGYNFVEPAMLAVVGTTPFKALLRVRVRNQDGTKLSYLKGLRRTFSVWVFGQGLGIPLITLIAGIYSYNRLSKDGITSWDQAGNLTVSHQTVAWWRWLLMIASLAAFGGFIALGNQE